MRQLILIILIGFCFLNKLTAQTTYKSVDSTTYAMYINKDWSNLTSYGEKAIANGFNYFYLNLRLGIAYFNLKNYKSSKLFLLDANKNYSFNETVKEYLFWNNYHLLNEKEAKKWYAKLSEKKQQRIQYQPYKIINSAYLGIGQKFSNDGSVAGNINYLNFSLEHHLSGRFNIIQGYKFSNQKLNWGSFSQHQYYINPSYLINENLKFNIALHGAFYKSNLNYSTDTLINEPTGISDFTPNATTSTTINSKYLMKGTYNENDFLIEPRFTKSLGKFTISPYLSYYISANKPNYTQTILDSINYTENLGSTLIYQSLTVNDSLLEAPTKKTMNQFAIGTNIYFTYQFLTLGADVKYISYSSKNYFYFSPFLKINLSKKIQISSYYFNKKAYVISLFEGAQLINSANEIKKFNLTSQYKISNKTNLFITYQHENIRDFISSSQYQLNSIYFGLKLKF